MKNPDTIRTELNDEATVTLPQLAANDAVVGRLIGFTSQGKPLVRVEMSGQSYSIPATATFALFEKNIGEELVLLFANADMSEPIIVAFLSNTQSQSYLDVLINNSQSEQAAEAMKTDDPASENKQSQLIEPAISRENNEVVVRAADKLVLKCGEASITLTDAGEVLIRGKMIHSDSKGVNRILGASVQLN